MAFQIKGSKSIIVAGHHWIHSYDQCSARSTTISVPCDHGRPRNNILTDFVQIKRLEYRVEYLIYVVFLHEVRHISWLFKLGWSIVVWVHKVIVRLFCILNANSLVSNIADGLHYFLLVFFFSFFFQLFCSSFEGQFSHNCLQKLLQRQYAVLVLIYFAVRTHLYWCLCSKIYCSIILQTVPCIFPLAFWTILCRLFRRKGYNVERILLF
jgi:hypothetical protein